MSKKDKILGILKSSTFWGVVLFFALIAVDQVTKVVADAYFSAPDIDGKVYFFSDDEIEYGKTYQIQIRKTSDYDLYGDRT